jgi:hypothetical protein
MHALASLAFGISAEAFGIIAKLLVLAVVVSFFLYRRVIGSRQSRPIPAQPKSRPVLKQFGKLKAADFRSFPVWIGCHGSDDDTPWYDETNEETFRASIDPLPITPNSALYLVSAEFTLADGTSLSGFVTPALDNNLQTIQPHVFVGASQFGFWGGVIGVSADSRTKFYEALHKSAAQVFPMSFVAAAGLVKPQTSGVIGGFYKINASRAMEFEL